LRNRHDASTIAELIEDGSVDSPDGDSWSDVWDVQDAGPDVASVISDALAEVADVAVPNEGSSAGDAAPDVASVISDASAGDVSAEAAPSPTTEVTLIANLYYSDPYFGYVGFCDGCSDTPCDLMDTIGVFDSNGHSQQLYIGFNQVAPNTWDYVLSGNTNVGAPYSGPCVDFGSGTLTFADSGALQSVTSTGGTITFPGSSSPQTITVDFGTPIDENGSGLDGVTQFDSNPQVFVLSANGSP
jgi:hypothetical protein